MKELKFKLREEHPDMSSDVQWTSGSLADLFWAMPSFPAAIAAAGGFPPMNKLNLMLKRGKDLHPTDGHGVEWKPFQLTDDEYLELGGEMMSDPRVAEHVKVSDDLPGSDLF